ncbi:hypothetical protein BX265_1527 [Streptomyces sp. TLI_235]|nr:hypothetical protein [Streptomyces sp. TLI_235]PBC76806.1 hypothetical protein BX265_1527 [Streptomyces sp. TLI_235]
MKALFAGLFDDAALFPPGDLPLAEAVPAHRGHRAAWYAPAVGPFLCGPGRLADLLATAGTGPLPVGLVLPQGGPGPAEALKAAAGLDVVGIEIATADVAATVAQLAAELPEGVDAAVELPRGGRPEDTLDALAGTPYRAKYRTGGLTAEAFPPVGELAAFLVGCADRALPYKCTAGLHHAVRHTDPRTGFEHHGFLNVLLAAAAGDRAGAVEALNERSATVVAAAVAALTDTQVAAARRSFTSFGTCSIAEPLDDLADLGLLSPPPLEDR